MKGFFFFFFLLLSNINIDIWNNKLYKTFKSIFWILSNSILGWNWINFRLLLPQIRSESVDIEIRIQLSLYIKKKEKVKEKFTFYKSNFLFFSIFSFKYIGKLIRIYIKLNQYLTKNSREEKKKREAMKRYYFFLLLILF